MRKQKQRQSFIQQEAERLRIDESEVEVLCRQRDQRRPLLSWVSDSDREGIENPVEEASTAISAGHFCDCRLTKITTEIHRLAPRLASYPLTSSSLQKIARASSEAPWRRRPSWNEPRAPSENIELGDLPGLCHHHCLQNRPSLHRAILTLPLCLRLRLRL